MATADSVRPPIGWARWAVAGVTTEDADRIWSVVDAALPSLAELRGGPPAVRGIDDVGVPPNRLSEFVPKVQDILRRYDTTAAFLAHPLDGHAHVRPFLNLAKSEDAARLWSIAQEVNNAALRGRDDQHAAWHRDGPNTMGREGVPSLLPIFRELKTVFDPRHLFNPGNIVGPDRRGRRGRCERPSRAANRATASAASTKIDGESLRRSPLGTEELLLWQSGELSRS